MPTLGANWHKSTRSNNDGACVEARRLGDAVQLRDSTDRRGPIVSVTPTSWTVFVAEIRRGTFNRT